MQGERSCLRDGEYLRGTERLSDTLADFFIKAHSVGKCLSEWLGGVRYKTRRGENSPPWRAVSCQTPRQTSTETLKKTQGSPGEFHWNKHTLKSQVRQSLSYRQQTGDFCVWWPDLNSPCTVVSKQECEIFINVLQQSLNRVEGWKLKIGPPPAVWIYEFMKWVSVKSGGYFLSDVAQWKKVQKLDLFASTGLEWANQGFLMACYVRRCGVVARRRSHASTCTANATWQSNKSLFTEGGRLTHPHVSCWGCLESTADNRNLTSNENLLNSWYFGNPTHPFPSDFFLVF